MDCYISSGSGEMGKNGGTDKKPKCKTFESRLENIESMKFPWDERYRIFNDCVLRPMLADLTNQTGLVHSTYTYTDIDKHPWCLSLQSDRPRGAGFWNAIGRFFGTQREVMDIKFNGQLWTCRYYQGFYYITAERVREIYYDKMREPFGGHDMVIIGAT